MKKNKEQIGFIVGTIVLIGILVVCIYALVDLFHKLFQML